MSSLAARLAQRIGADHVAADEKTRQLHSADIYARGGLADLVVRPQSTVEVADVVAATTEAGFAIVPRGGGMSYTGGYTAADAGAVVLDLRRMNKILDVSPADMTVRVQAGVTWAQLREALAPLRLRTPFWGPLSGLASTIGGGLSQNNAFFGAGTYGPLSESVVALTVVTASGEQIRTGAGGEQPFFRHFGPDLTGLFLGDCGALGVKTEATLRLIPAPEHEAWASFSFPDAASWIDGLAQVARAGRACEAFGFDPNLARVRMRRASLMADASALASVVSAQKSLLAGLKEGTRVALAGRSFLDRADYSAHVCCEGRSKAGVEADINALRSILAQAGGTEVENTIPKVLRAQPFTPLNAILGPDGERWAPVHGIVSMSRAPEAFAALEQVFAERAEAFARLGVATGYLVATLATNGFLIEPVFYWPDEVFEVHLETVEPAHMAKLKRHDPNPEAREIVREARAAVVAAFARFDAAHFQLGRAYPYLDRQTPANAALLKALKAALDPAGRMNPGALGL